MYTNKFVSPRVCEGFVLFEHVSRIVQIITNTLSDGAHEFTAEKRFGEICDSSRAHTLQKGIPAECDTG